MERRCQRGTAVPTSEIKISTSAERGKRKGGGERGEFGVAIPCVTRVTFQIFNPPHQFLLFIREVRRKETLHLELLLLGL